MLPQAKILLEEEMRVNSYNCERDDAENAAVVVVVVTIAVVDVEVVVASVVVVVVAAEQECRRCSSWNKKAAAAFLCLIAAKIYRDFHPCKKKSFPQCCDEKLAF